MICFISLSKSTSISVLTSKCSNMIVCEKFWFFGVIFGWLWVFVDGCGWLWVVVGNCRWLWVVLGSCGWVVVGCRWLWVIVGGCRWLWVVADGCGWLHTFLCVYVTWKQRQHLTIC